MNNTEGRFQFMDDENNVLNLKQSVRYINVLANSGSSVKFLVKGLKLGQLNVSLTASSPLATDAIHVQLKVEAEGILINNNNQEVYLNLLPGTAQKSSLKAEIPKEIVAESEFLRLSVGGDILVPCLENLHQLVLLPTGCGEQNMINFVPNILVLDYLKSINKMQQVPELVAKALNYIETGYQRELTYRHDTGGYSVFGPGGTESTWLTAYVVRFFIKAAKYVAVEPAIITSGLDFLALKQQANGEIANTGYLFYPAHQNRCGFTAFVLLSFLENWKYRRQYNQVIEKGLDFLSSNINHTNDAYALSIMATALRKAESNKVSLVRYKLLALQQEEGSRKWWTSTEKGHSNAVEITSYAAMSLLETSETEHISIFRWLIEQRNENGGFKTTHDTVVGLQALIKFTEIFNNLHDTAINVTYLAKDEQELEVKRGIFHVTADNFMILQRQELPRTTRFIQYEATGRGNSLLQFSYQYYVADAGENSTNDDVGSVTQLHASDAFNMTIESRGNFIEKYSKRQRSLISEQLFVIEPVAKMYSHSKMLMEVCFKYKPSGEIPFQTTNMIILDINLPSGFVCNSQTTQELLEEELVTKVELQNADSKIIIYFDQLNANDKHCLHLQADKVYEVEMLRPAVIEMYDFYNLDLRNIVFYEIKM